MILISGAIAALLCRNLVRATIALGIASGALAMIFFALDAPYAGGFELSVGAGLISVLFILGISLTRSLEAESDDS